MYNVFDAGESGLDFVVDVGESDLDFVVVVDSCGTCGCCNWRYCCSMLTKN